MRQSPVSGSTTIDALRLHGIDARSSTESTLPTPLQTVGEAVAAREEEERGNAMKALENRTLDSKKEMDIMDALEELIVSAASPAQHCRRHRWLRTSCHMEVMAQHRRERR